MPLAERVTRIFPPPSSSVDVDWFHASLNLSDVLDDCKQVAKHAEDREPADREERRERAMCADRRVEEGRCRLPRMAIGTTPS